MAPSEPRRAIVAGTLVAGSFGTLSGGLLFAGAETAAWGVYVFMALPFAIAMVTAWYVHAIDAMLITAVLTATAFFLIGWLGDCLEGLVVLLPTLCGSMVSGAILGLLLRAIVRRSSNSSKP